jgi:hypothetical protein
MLPPRRSPSRSRRSRQTTSSIWVTSTTQHSQRNQGAFP